jgi:hypothetical protein
MTRDCDDSPPRAKSQTAKDKQEVRELTQHYKQWMNWKDQGILHDLRVKHHRDNPSRLLLLSIAMGVAQQQNLPLGRQEKRRRELLIGWINKHYDHFRGIIDELVLADTTGKLSGDLQNLSGMLPLNPDDEDLAAIAKEFNFQGHK